MSGDSEPEPWTAQPPLVEGLVDPRPLGQGGFGTVFRAWQTGIGREVALKVGGQVLSDERSRRQFLREANAAGRLSSHANIVAVYDAGVAEDGRPYLIMELCSRGSLVDRLRAGGPLPPEEVRGVGVGIADALATAHAAGVLHRDVKPGNILVDEYGVAKLADFGLAAVLDASGDSSVTREGMTPAYSPPEAFAFARPTTLLDVYGLAATLYALLAGRPPRMASWPPSSLADLTAGLRAPVPPVPGVHSDLLAVLARALDPEPDNRTAGAAVLRDELRELPAAAAPGSAGPGRSAPAILLTGASATLPSLSAPAPDSAATPPPGPATTDPAADGSGADRPAASRPAASGPAVSGPAVSGPAADDPGDQPGVDEPGPGQPGAGPVPPARDAVSVRPLAGAGPSHRASRVRRWWLAAAVVPVVVAIITVPLLLSRGGAQDSVANGPTAGPVTNADGQTSTPSARPTSLPTAGPSGPGTGPSGPRTSGAPTGAPGTGPTGPHTSGSPTTTPTGRPPATGPAGPPTTPAGQPGTGLPPTLVACSGSADVLCPTTPTCWDVVVAVGDSRSAPPPKACSQPHRVEAYAAGRVPTAGNATPVIAHACSPPRMRDRASGDIKGWKRDVQQLQIPDYGWFFYCVAAPKDGSPVTGHSFITGP